jgi:hypothetical protein
LDSNERQKGKNKMSQITLNSTCLTKQKKLGLHSVGSDKCFIEGHHPAQLLMAVLCNLPVAKNKIII